MTDPSGGPKDDRYRFDVGLHYIGDCAEGGLFHQVLFPREQRGIDRYIGFLREIDRVIALVEKGAGKPRVIAEVLLRARKVGLNLNATIGSFLDGCTKDLRLRAVLLGQHGDYGLPPCEASTRDRSS